MKVYFQIYSFSLRRIPLQSYQIVSLNSYLLHTKPCKRDYRTSAYTTEKSCTFLKFMTLPDPLRGPFQKLEINLGGLLADGLDTTL